MKRSLSVALVATAFAFAGCEDGPNQTFNPSPAGAGGTWNNGNSAGNANPGSQGFVASGSTGTNRNELCDVQTKHDVWSAMVKKPIHPPSVGGGLDIAGGPKGDGVPDINNDLTKEAWTGLTLDAAEKINCQSTFAYDVYGDGAVYDAYWGDNGEVQVNYLVSTRQLLSVVLAQGYLGTLEVDSADKMHHYSVGVSVPISLDHAPLPLDWNNTSDFQTKVNALYNAVTATYSPFAPEADCFSTGHCISKKLNEQYAYIWFTTVGLTMIFANPYVNTTIGATPIEIDQEKTKVLGFTDSSVMLQNDAAGVGPLVHRPNVFGTGKDCNMQLGQDFGTFRDSCVAPSTDATKNAVEMTKLFAGLTHGAETFGFDVVGVDPRFLAASIKDQDIIQDGQLPANGDLAYSLVVDQNTSGAFANDWVNNDPWTVNAGLGLPKQDWHGIGLVTLQWATRLQNDFNLATGNTHVLGDPLCLGNKTNAQLQAAGCSGLEGIVTTAPRAARALANDVNALGDAPINANPADTDPKNKFFKGIAPGLKPTTWQVYFCTDGAGLDGTNKLSGYTASNCNKNAGTPSDISYFKHALNQMIAVAGGGKVTALPTDLQDIRTLFKEWIFALVQYLGVANNSTATLAQVGAITVDQNNLFFDSVGSGQFEFAEYIDRRNVTATNPPLDLRIDADILHAIINDYDFSRALFRGEKALYTAMRGGKTTPLADDNNKVFLTDVFGSFTLSNLYKAKAGSGYTTYDCAINDHTKPAVDDACGGDTAHAILGAGALLDNAGKLLKNDDGTLLLAPYKGAFGTVAAPATDFTVGSKSSITPLTITPLIQAAWVELPVHTDPYNIASSLLTPVRKLIPWLPEGASVGFPIAINGQQDKWIETFQLDFSGITVSANVDYQLVTTNNVQQLQIEAVETTDFLGEVFVCADPNANLSKDGDAVLHVRMYSPASIITTWFKNHPAGITSCGIIYQYSTFGNYLDTVTSTVNGVRLGINPGGGQGRVIDVTLFDPNVAAQ